ncbi:MAG: UvrB/UvrC motif-containing protein, partial [Phycisphaerae bacterium]
RAVHANVEQYDRDELMRQIEKEMLEAADELDFERAAELHAKLERLQEGEDAVTVMATDDRSTRKSRKGRKGAGNRRW